MSNPSQRVLGLAPETPSHLTALREEARALAMVVEPYAVQADESSSVFQPVLEALRASQLARVAVPAEFGGRLPSIDPVALCVVREVLMATSSHLDMLFTAQGLASYPIALAGSDELKARWLPAVASMDALASIAITEPDAGSDVKNISSIVRRDGNRMRIDGQKTFISNAGFADFYTTLVREEAGLSLFLVKAASPGLTVGPPHDLIAPHIIADLVFDGVEVEDTERIGEPGRGLEIVLSTLGLFRVSVGAAAVGLAWRALQEAVRHTRVRRQFGRPLAQLGPVASLLADSWTEIEMTRLLVYRAAEIAASQDPNSLTYGSMAKLAATEMASRVTDRCIQVMGRFGLVHGSVVERLYRQARPMRVYEGASEVLRLGISATLVKEMD
jgi:acyl-CoA dehydrogenase